MLVNDIHTCPDADCAFCNTYDELMRNERVQKFFNSKEFTKQCKLSVDTEQCYQIMGWGNFILEVWDIDPMTCKNRFSGDYLYFSFQYGWLTICLCLQELKLPIICMLSTFSHIQPMAL
jgi:hypothetical protein